jgi:hypothetical protein
VIRMTVPKVGKLVNGFTLAAQFVPGAVKQNVRHQAQLLLTRILANASGRPGPRHVTGDYKRSWTGQLVASAPGRDTWVVGTNAPQGPRLEYGFVGVDSIGRHYNQPPYPHVGPAVDAIEKQFNASFDTVVHGALKKVP